MQDNALRNTLAPEAEPRVRIEGDRAKVPSADGLLDLPVMPLPTKFVDWIEQGRRSMYGKLMGKASPGFFTSHLPVVTTQSPGPGFPFNCSNKGVGFLPKPEYLQEFVDLFRRTLENTRGRPWQESMKERIAAVSSFYFDRDRIDYRALSTLEIFEKGTYRNLSKLPLAAVHYTGNAPDYISFQVNCAVEIIRPDDPRHAFVHLARIMFEYDSFHISQTNFPYAYVLWISEVLDKTPFRVPEKDQGKIITLAKKGDMAWDADAIESINRAPGMIRQFITEAIEKYARDRGFDRITMTLVREAREVLERTQPADAEPASPPPPAEAHPDAATLASREDHPAAAAPKVPEAHRAPEAPVAASPAAPSAAFASPEPGSPASRSFRKDGGEAARPYADIYVGLDSSGPSDEAMALAITIGKKLGAAMTGSHVYAAKMHDNRFRAMEGGLPEEFQKEKELNRQRKIHDTLITKGLELITDSYLEAMAKACAEADLEFTGVSLEGKNWKALADDIDVHDHDLVVMGAHGIGRVGNSQLGTVAERLVRRVKRDLLLVKVPEAENLSDEILVGLDGSERSWGALRRSLQLAKAFGKKVTAVSAFDPYFHYAMFKSLNRTLTEKARKVFKFEEQEKLHEDIIDSGLAKIYQSYLNIAKRMAAEEGVEIAIELLDGKPFEKILQRVRKSPPWLLALGRIGFHSDEDMDVGGNTENLCRLAPCNILVVDAKAKPPAEYQAEETVAWTKEARARLDRIPAMAQGMAMKAIQNYCISEGFTVVTESVLNAAIKTLLPPEALKRMGLAEDPAASAGPAGTAAAESQDRIALSFKCQACGHVHHGSRPHLCPICGMGGHMFKLVESAIVEDGQVLATLGDRQLIWERPALAALDGLPEALVREQIKNRLEKRALTQRLAAITLDMVRAELDAERASAAPPRPETPAPSTAPHAAPSTGSTASSAAPPPPAGLLWTEEAMKRIERVPPGFMRKAAQDMVEKHAKAQGLSEIDLAAAEAGLGKAREKMQSAIAGAPEAHASGEPASVAQAHTHPIPAPGNPSAAPQTWECHLCGLMVDGGRPDKCPNCGTGHFTPVSAEDRAKAAPAALQVRLDWDPEAAVRLDRIPVGFMRDMTRNRVEKWARAAGVARVGLEVMDGKYGSWAEGSAKVNLELEWSEEARERADRIPEFIRPMVMKELERRVKAAGKIRVEAAELDEAMKQWSGSGRFHGHG